MNKGLKEKILGLRKEGKTYDEISSILDCSKATVSYHCSDKVKDYYRKARTINRRKQRTQLKEKFGGKCSICSYDRCLNALDFHHLDPNIKEDRVSYIFQTRGMALALKEASKCILVCRNCHAEIHSKNWSE